LPAKTKTTPSGWKSFNSVCCHHNGQSTDTRMRGGIVQAADSVSYHCFNCGFKTSWQPGRPLSNKMKKLLRWLGALDDEINKLALAVLRINEGIQIQQHIVGLPSFNEVKLPEGSRLITDDFNSDNKYLSKVVEYMSSRKILLNQGYEYYWSPELAFRDRFIIPFYYNKKIVGWTARTYQPDSKYKYISEQQPGYVFNLDQQTENKAFCIVTEGSLDALYIDAVGVLSNEISKQQAMMLNRLNKDIIVLPDRDKAGKKLVEQSIELGYSVSMPNWKENIKDVSDAVREYGQLYTLYSIVSAAESSPLKIRLKEKKWFNV
jgi:5S rRNA maturation endonuclease (ribonuclease M5)